MPAKTIAIMQPYLFPYLGYFGLMAHADEFVVLDCVQFSRRGRVHRCQVPGPHGVDRWLTLPLARAPQTTRIDALHFGPDAERRWSARLDLHPWMQSATPSGDTLRAALPIAGRGVCDYLIDQMQLVRDQLGLSCEISRSSTLDIAPHLRGAARLVAIAQARGATRYINAPGGRALYDPAFFARDGISLAFLPAYAGPFRHLLPAMMRGAQFEMAEDLAHYTARPLDWAEVAHA